MIEMLDKFPFVFPEVPKEDFSQDDSFNGDEVTEISEEHDDDDDEEGVSKLKSKSKKRRGSGSSSPHTKVSKPKVNSFCFLSKLECTYHLLMCFVRMTF